jgi:hypothetical protein
MALTGPYRTYTDLIDSALARMGVLAPGQPVDVEDFNNVQVELDSIFRKLAGLEIVFVSDPNNIPSVWFSDLVDIVAGECATKFNSTPDDYMRLINKGLGGVQGVDVGYGAAAKSLRAIMRSRPTGQPLQIDYF